MNVRLVQNKEEADQEVQITNTKNTQIKYSNKLPKKEPAVVALHETALTLKERTDLGKEIEVEVKMVAKGVRLIQTLEIRISPCQ